MNILKKQTISIGLCFALAVSTLSAFTPATAAAKAKLVKKKLTLTVGQKKKISIKSKKKKAKIQQEEQAKVQQELISNKEKLDKAEELKNDINKTEKEK